jgi:hypothetical protein
METEDFFVLVAAVIAAIASVANVIISSRNQRDNKIWEKELERVFDLEEKVGVLVDDLVFFRCRTEGEKEKFYQMQHYLPNAMGRFRRHPELHEALRLVFHDAGWYFNRDMKHENSEEFAEAKGNLLSSYAKFLEACDKVLSRN